MPENNNPEERRKDCGQCKNGYQELTRQVTENTKRIKDMQANIEPINEGVTAIRESVKVLGWIGTGVKWVGTTAGGAIATWYFWQEYLQHLFKGIK